MSELQLSHFIYGPAPKKGYSIRARSADVTPQALEYLLGNFVPIDEYYIGGASQFETEARMAVQLPESGIMYYCRLMRRPKLDEMKRTGILNHVVAVPRAEFKNGLDYSDIEAAMLAFEKQHGIALGEMPKMPLSYDNKDIMENMKRYRAHMGKNSLHKLIEHFSKNSGIKMVVSYPGSSFRDRHQVSFLISLLLDMDLGLVPISFSTEPLMQMQGSCFNILVSDAILDVPPRIGWNKMSIAVEGDMLKGEKDKEKVARRLDELNS